MFFFILLLIASAFIMRNCEPNYVDKIFTNGTIINENGDIFKNRAIAIKMFTVWPAYAAFKENYKSVLKVGTLADFTVLDKNILTIPPPEILKTRVVMTVVGGEIRYSTVLP